MKKTERKHLLHGSVSTDHSKENITVMKNIQINYWNNKKKDFNVFQNVCRKQILCPSKYLNLNIILFILKSSNTNTWKII